MMITNMKKKPIELYIHIPFCVKKCDYCDFLSFRALSSVHEAYVQQLIREIRAQSCYCTDCQVVSVFIGGGTPSLLEPSCISRIMETVFSCFQVEPEAEITIEANPGTLLGKKLPVYRQCGINRVSIGLQSADNTELKNLGRIHSFEEFLKSFQSARMAGFTNINIDLMSGIPGQTLESWKNTFIFLLLQLCMCFFIPLIQALLLNELIRLQKCLTTLYILPALIPTSVNVIIWRWIWHPDYGVANQIVKFFGGEPQVWLSDPDLVKFCIIFPGVLGGGLTVLYPVDHVCDHYHAASGCSIHVCVRRTQRSFYHTRYFYL